MTIPRIINWSASCQTPKKPDHIGLLGNKNTKNPRPKPHEKPK